ncbi:MAG: EAP30/Vps36 family vacuolar-sorting protein [Candidatus Heimdallarchaeum endolithica]|uniref:EAP30/Vps36 family vacuolar-sorting protein n=1 Tax=Candidatus Heimdallarchaeum endolithica TaxID=2876572 RepID=A0A9Y1BR74_9ARCH|nr:MAG: EAP30/Vps36 family vacuolar-sorting protein [Candidatus Heimdallarchaeum endolithica]
MILMGKGKGNKESKDDKKETEEISNDDFRSSLSQAYKAFDTDLVSTQEKDKQKRKEILKEGIIRVEKESKRLLKSSKLLVNKIMELRKQAGLSGSIGTAGKMKNPVLFGSKGFEQKLRQEILLIGNEELDEFGGAITLGNFINYFKETRPNWEVSPSHIIRAIRSLQKDKVIPPEVDLGEDEVLIRFKPLETSSDFRAVLQLATGLESLTKDILVSHLGWSSERALDTLSKMVEVGLAIEDEETGQYYFPGIFKLKLSK